MLKHIIRRQQGDTIVEVLIAIAVASAVLGSAYAIVNRTVKSQQQTSEHTDAVKLAESQLEFLRSYVGSTTNDFCFKPNGTYEPNSNGGTKCKANSADRYTFSVTKDPATNTFTAHVSWDGIHGSTNSVDLLYRAY